VVVLHVGLHDHSSVWRLIIGLCPRSDAHPSGSPRLPFCDHATLGSPLGDPHSVGLASLVATLVQRERLGASALPPHEQSGTLDANIPAERLQRRFQLFGSPVTFHNPELVTGHCRPTNEMGFVERVFFEGSFEFVIEVDATAGSEGTTDQIPERFETFRRHMRDPSSEEDDVVRFARLPFEDIGQNEVDPRVIVDSALGQFYNLPRRIHGRDGVRILEKPIRSESGAACDLQYMTCGTEAVQGRIDLLGPRDDLIGGGSSRGVVFRGYLAVVVDLFFNDATVLHSDIVADFTQPDAGRGNPPALGRSRSAALRPRQQARSSQDHSRCMNRRCRDRTLAPKLEPQESVEF
jgi:hypothetical protein